jgi:hypothetical protein
MSQSIETVTASALPSPDDPCQDIDDMVEAEREHAQWWHEERPLTDTEEAELTATLAAPLTAPTVVMPTPPRHEEGDDGCPF